MHNKARVS